MRLPTQLNLEIHERLATHAGGPLIGADLAERFGIPQVHRRGGIAPGIVVEHVLEVQAELQIDNLAESCCVAQQESKREAIHSSPLGAKANADPEPPIQFERSEEITQF